MEKKIVFLYNIFFWLIFYSCWKFFKSRIIFYFLFLVILLFFFVCGLLIIWIYVCFLRFSCYFLVVLFVRKIYLLVFISLSIKNNVFGLISKLFYCLIKCLISAEVFYNFYFIVVLVIFFILIVLNYVYFILFDFFVVNCYVFFKFFFLEVNL